MNIPGPEPKMATGTISAIGTVTIYDGIDKVDASSIKNSSRSV